MMRSQALRPSQFILMYGPGAILEGPHGPRIIPGANAGLFYGLSPEKFRIEDARMSDGILDGRKIFRLPSNFELNYKPGEPVYRTAPFPRWKVCMDKSGHDNAYLLYQDGRSRRQQCPVCGNRRGQGATRFVAACPKGHLDEVPWEYIVHGSAGCGTAGDSARNADDPSRILFRGGGGPISSIELECSRCCTKTKFGVAYGRSFQCTGRSPENEPPILGPPQRTRDCQAGMRIIQRQASNLRIPVVETHFTIRPLITELHHYMRDNGTIRTWVEKLSPGLSKETLLDELELFFKHGTIPRTAMDEIRRSDPDTFQDAVNYALENREGGFGEMVADEFRELLRAAKDGAPPERPKGGVRVLFEVERGSTSPVRGPDGKELRVTPIKRLRTVTVQTGFRRIIESGKSVEVSPGPKLVDISFEHRGDKWYPGVEFLGEGIFVSSSDQIIGSKGCSTERWLEADSGGYDRMLSQHGMFRELDPVFVWWHTLSHALTRTISEHAGYSSASIRERVYTSDSGGGGILLYATQPGNDGTMGGLISLVPFFESILYAALERVGSCSGDPLCHRQGFTAGDLNGAACYGCVMNSETSCEHRNMWLDRHVLLENRP